MRGREDRQRHREEDHVNGGGDWSYVAKSLREPAEPSQLWPTSLSDSLSPCPGQAGLQARPPPCQSGSCLQPSALAAAFVRMRQPSHILMPHPSLPSGLYQRSPAQLFGIAPPTTTHTYTHRSLPFSFTLLKSHPLHSSYHPLTCRNIQFLIMYNSSCLPPPCTLE